MAYFEVKKLSLSIDKTEILKDISFEIEKNTITLIAGMNGSGKSMLLKTIKGLEKPKSGEIVLDGEILKKSKERMRRIGLVFQDSSLQIVGSTLRKDIAFGLENLGKDRAYIERECDRLLKLFSLEDKAVLSPSILSGGEKRKLSILGVIAMDTDLLLLDEPFANLDYPSTKIVINTLLMLKEMGNTIIIVSHEAEKFLKHTDKTIILKNGMIRAQGESKDMLSSLRENDIYIPKNAEFEALSWLE